jgi:sodium/hydrogen antiporter
MALMFTFVLFGVSVIWKGLGILGAGTLLFVFAAFAARPLSFVPALLFTKVSWKNRCIISWFGPRGLSSLLLVLLAVFAGSPGSEYLLTVCCLVVLFSVVLHGLSPSLLVQSPAPATASPGTPAVPQDPDVVEAMAGDQCPLRRAESNGLVEQDFISIAELKSLQDRSANVVVVDARREKGYVNSGEVIPGAVRIPPEQPSAKTAARLGISKDAVIAVVCACPNDSTSERVAGELRKAGWTHARALRGGWNAWVEEKMPVVKQLSTH